MIAWNASAQLFLCWVLIVADYEGLEVPSFQSYVTSALSQTADKNYILYVPALVNGTYQNHVCTN